MSRTPKTRPGGKVQRVGEIVSCIEDGRWLYYRHKPYHPSVIANWSLHTIMGAIRGGYLRHCVDNQEGGPYTSGPAELPF